MSTDDDLNTGEPTDLTHSRTRRPRRRHATLMQVYRHQITPAVDAGVDAANNLFARKVADAE
jgi:hypothetical protein